MSWSADVPFPAEEMSPCKGCGTWIGWVRFEDPETGKERAHPVDPKGWAGVPCGPDAPGAKRGYTREGDKAAVADPGPASLFAVKDLDVVFTSHFSTCPERARFYGGRR